MRPAEPVFGRAGAGKMGGDVVVCRCASGYIRRMLRLLPESIHCMVLVHTTFRRCRFSVASGCLPDVACAGKRLKRPSMVGRSHPPSCPLLTHDILVDRSWISVSRGVATRVAPTHGSKDSGPRASSAGGTPLNGGACPAHTPPRACRWLRNQKYLHIGV